MRSGCVLDLSLRLLLLWTGADRHDLVAAWVNDLVKLVSSTATSRAQTDAGKIPEMPSLRLAVLYSWVSALCQVQETPDF